MKNWITRDWNINWHHKHSNKHKCNWKRFHCFKSDAWGKTHVTLAIAQGFNTTYEGGKRDDSGKNHCDATYTQVKLDVAG